MTDTIWFLIGLAAAAPAALLAMEWAYRRGERNGAIAIAQLVVRKGLCTIDEISASIEDEESRIRGMLASHFRRHFRRTKGPVV